MFKCKSTTDEILHQLQIAIDDLIKYSVGCSPTQHELGQYHAYHVAKSIILNVTQEREEMGYDKHE